MYYFLYVKAKLPLLLSRMNEVAKVFLATNSDYKYTDVSLLMQEHNYPPQIQVIGIFAIRICY